MVPTATVGIPTTYRHTNFRSRLEARWAAFMDLIEWPWVYEPLDAAGYIPDFFVQGLHPFFIEVGPCITEGDYRGKAEKPDMAFAGLGHDVLVVGTGPVAPIPITDSGALAARLLGESASSWTTPLDRTGRERIGPEAVEDWMIVADWGEAGNAVQWKRR